MNDIGHSGLCMICGKPINIVPVLGSSLDIFLCPECEKGKRMSDILQYKALFNKIKEALNDKVIGDVHVECRFDPYVCGTAMMVIINDPSLWEMKSSYYRNTLRWRYSVVLEDYIIKNSINDEEEFSKLISETVSNVLDKYKEYVHKRYFFD